MQNKYNRSDNIKDNCNSSSRNSTMSINVEKNKYYDIKIKSRYVNKNGSNYWISHRYINIKNNISNNDDSNKSKHSRNIKI